MPRAKPTPTPTPTQAAKATDGTVTFVSDWAHSVDLTTAGIARSVTFEGGKLMTDDAEVIKALRGLIARKRIVSVREVKA